MRPRAPCESSVVPRSAGHSRFVCSFRVSDVAVWGAECRGIGSYRKEGAVVVEGMGSGMQPAGAGAAVRMPSRRWAGLVWLHGDWGGGWRWRLVRRRSASSPVHVLSAQSATMPSCMRAVPRPIPASHRAGPVSAQSPMCSDALGRREPSGLCSFTREFPGPVPRASSPPQYCQQPLRQFPLTHRQMQFS